MSGGGEPKMLSKDWMASTGECSPNNFLKITYGTYLSFSNYYLLNWGSWKVCYLNINFLIIGI